MEYYGEKTELRSKIKEIKEKHNKGPVKTQKKEKSESDSKNETMA